MTCCLAIQATTLTKELTQPRKTYLYSNVFSGRFQDLTQAQRKKTN